MSFRSSGSKNQNLRNGYSTGFRVKHGMTTIDLSYSTNVFGNVFLLQHFIIDRISLLIKTSKNYFLDRFILL